MKILDWYILKRYLFTFFMMLLLFIPIGITVHLAEKIGKILRKRSAYRRSAYAIFMISLFILHIYYFLCFYFYR